MISAMKNILVTGGAGYIGSHTVVELINAGYRPVIVDNFANSDKKVIERLKKLTKQDIYFYEQDFQDQVKLNSIIKNEKIDGVIHFAAYKAVGESVQEPIKYYDNNVAGFVKLLEVLEENKIPNLVFSSSCTVYGEPNKLPITESAAIKPATSPYGATKQMCETILSDVSHASKTMGSLSLRYFNPIGAHESAEIGELPIGTPANLVPHITQATAGLRGELTVYGRDYPTPDGTCIRDYIHVADLANAHVKALQHLDKRKPSYYDFCNIGTGKGSSVLDVIKTFEKVTGQKVPYKIGTKRDGDIMAVYADVTKSKKMLGWQAEKKLDDALADAWRWQQNILKIN
jgi:UDP-glucose 4-epimerase